MDIQELRKQILNAASQNSSNWTGRLRRVLNAEKAASAELVELVEGAVRDLREVANVSLSIEGHKQTENGDVTRQITLTRPGYDEMIEWRMLANDLSIQISGLDDEGIQFLTSRGATEPQKGVAWIEHSKHSSAAEAVGGAIVRFFR